MKLVLIPHVIVIEESLEWAYKKTVDKLLTEGGTIRMRWPDIIEYSKLGKEQRKKKGEERLPVQRLPGEQRLLRLEQLAIVDNLE